MYSLIQVPKYINLIYTHNGSFSGSIYSSILGCNIYLISAAVLLNFSVVSLCSSFNLIENFANFDFSTSASSVGYLALGDYFYLIVFMASYNYP